MALAVRVTLTGQKNFAKMLRKFPKGKWKQRALEQGRGVASLHGHLQGQLDFDKTGLQEVQQRGSIEA